MTIGIARIHRDECAFNIRQPPTFRQNQLTLATILPVGCYQSQSYRLKTWHPYRLKTWHQRHGPGFVILLFFNVLITRMALIHFHLYYLLLLSPKSLMKSNTAPSNGWIHCWVLTCCSMWANNTTTKLLIPAYLYYKDRRCNAFTY